MLGIIRLLTYPEPYRARLFRSIIKRFRLGSYLRRLESEAVDRPWYGWCLYNAALQAKALGYDAITAAEMGVAGGNGLVVLRDHADEVQRLTGVKVEVYGFDTGEGMPPSDDSRDLLYCWPAGSFQMDIDALRARLGAKVRLMIGDVQQTVTALQPPANAPLGVVLFDLDLYTSTIAALKLLDVSHRLPRVWCYFDDIFGYAENVYCDRNGERAAIKEYNGSARDAALLAPAHCVFNERTPRYWHAQIYIDHRFGHPLYNRCLSDKPHQLPLV